MAGRDKRGHKKPFSRERMRYIPAADALVNILDPVQQDKASRKSWARLIQKIYEIDPLCCPKCRGTMKLLLFYA
jgi:hypothetical protein